MKRSDFPSSSAFQKSCKSFRWLVANVSFIVGIRNFIQTAYTQYNHRCDVITDLLNQAHAWFFEIAFVRQVSVCVYVHPRGYKLHLHT